MDNQPNSLCMEFARILDATPSIINGVCTATKSRTNIRPVVLGRRAESFMFVPQAFSFENIDRDGKALCLGETVILQEEINPFITRLREDKIIVTAIHNHWLFDEPRLMYIHFESIDEPLCFAEKVRDALDVLTDRVIGGKDFRFDFGFHRGGSSKHAEELCEEFHEILGGMQTFEDGVCMVMKARTNIKPTVLGRRAQSFLLIPQRFAFESLTRDGDALCSGESVILQEEFNPLVSRLLFKMNIHKTGVKNRKSNSLCKGSRRCFRSSNNQKDISRKINGQMKHGDGSHASFAVLSFVSVLAVFEDNLINSFD